MAPLAGGSSLESRNYNRVKLPLRLLVVPLLGFLLGQWILFDLQLSIMQSFVSIDDQPSLNSSSSRNKNKDINNIYAIQKQNADSNTTLIEGGNQPNLLTREGRSKEHLFVHIGKAGGSSIQVMVKNARKKCEELTAEEKEKGGNSNSSERQKLVKAQVCALSTIPNDRVHLKERLHPEKHYAKHTQFLINLRDPIDRLNSWYNYEVASYRKEPRWTSANETNQASDNFRKLTKECYPGDVTEDGFVKMVHGGLLLSAPFDKNEQITVGTPVKSCDQLARFCLRGDIMCFGHNYYNYEVYLEEILLRKGLSSDNSRRRREGALPEHIRIDAIRSEYSIQDFNKTVGLWTSQTVEEWKDFPGVTPYVQSLYGQVRSIESYDNKHYKGRRKNKLLKQPKKEVLSPKARTALCKHICTELVVYKIALRAADNLDNSDVEESYRALDDHCGFGVDEVCGTTWTFRDVKAQKKVFEWAPW
jgi:hypothetical protein